MRILYDHQTFMYQSIGGMSQYFTQLIEHLPSGFAPILALDNTKNESALALEKYATKPFRTNVRRTRLQRISDRIRGRDLRRLNSTNSLEILANCGYDLFHPTAYDPYCLSAPRKSPMVITFHDCIHEHFPEYFGLTDNMTASKRLYLEKADAVICISEYARTELLKYFEYDEKRTYVVPHGVDHSAFRGAKEDGRERVAEYGVYLLFVGGRGGYKNWAYWLRALEGPMKRRKEVKIVCTGRDFSEDEKAFISSLGLAGRVLHVAASTAQLPGLYGGARAFFYPSLDEGFGLPTLEALASGCPAALSDIPVMREVAGGAAVYFDPKDRKSIESAFELLVGDGSAALEFSRLGFERASMFSWEKTARETANIYQRVLER